MNESDRKMIWKLIQAKGDSLQNTLKPHPNHPNGRNPYAHLCIEIKREFNCSYKDIPENKIDDLVSFIKNLNG